MDDVVRQPDLKAVRTPFIEVPPTAWGITRLVSLAKLWKRSYLYRSPETGRVILSAAELEGMEPHFLGVVGAVSRRELLAFFEHELGL